MDVALLDELESQHRMAEQLLAQLLQAEDADTQQPLVDELVTALTEHMDVEEREVYPELRRLDSEMAEEADNEHRLARQGLTSMQEMVGQPGFEAAVEMVKAGIAHHVEDEEGEAFPKLRSALGGGA